MSDPLRTDLRARPTRSPASSATRASSSCCCRDSTTISPARTNPPSTCGRACCFSTGSRSGARLHRARARRPGRAPAGVRGTAAPGRRRLRSRRDDERAIPADAAASAGRLARSGALVSRAPRPPRAPVTGAIGDRSPCPSRAVAPAPRGDTRPQPPASRWRHLCRDGHGRVGAFRWRPGPRLSCSNSPTSAALQRASGGVAARRGEEPLPVPPRSRYRTRPCPRAVRGGTRPRRPGSAGYHPAARSSARRGRSPSRRNPESARCLGAGRASGLAPRRVCRRAGCHEVPEVLVHRLRRSGSCRNCGYEFALSDAQPAPADLPMRAADDDGGPLADLALRRPAARQGERRRTPRRQAPAGS